MQYSEFTRATEREKKIKPGAGLTNWSNLLSRRAPPLRHTSVSFYEIPCELQIGWQRVGETNGYLS